MAKYRVRICRGPTCGDERQARLLAGEFDRAMREAGCAEATELCWQSCYGRCSKGPNVLVRELQEGPAQRTFSVATPPPSTGGPATMYNYVTPVDVVEIVTDHLVKGRPARRLLEAARRRAAAEELAIAQEIARSTNRDGDS